MVLLVVVMKALTPVSYIPSVAWLSTAPILIGARDGADAATEH